MTKSYKELTRNVGRNLGKLKKAIPATTDGFTSLASAAMEDNALDKKTKELIALAIAVSTRCDACIGFHTKALVRLKASREEIVETLGVCVYMGGGPAYMYAANAIESFDEFMDGNP